MSNRKGLSNVLMGVVLGIVLILGSIVALFWNEGRSIQTAQSLAEGADAVVSVESESVDPANDGDLVHMSGRLDSDAILRDPEFPVTEEALALRREVEMYQWHEEQERRGDETRYSYHTDWSSRVIDSRRFNRTARHENPGSMPYERYEVRADDITLGVFHLSETFTRQLDNFRTVGLDEGILEELPGNVPAQPHVVGNRLYFGENPNNPQVGDTRVAFSIIEPHEASVIGEQQGSMLSSYATRAGDNLAMVSAGRYSPGEMFEQAMAENVMLTWMLRGGGLFAMFLGFVMFFGPIGYVARFIPFVGALIVGAKKLMSAGLTMLLGGGTIAVAWLFYRPLVGIPLLLIFGAVAVGAFLLAVRAAPTAAEARVEREDAAATA